jgi:hypothetical protein
MTEADRHLVAAIPGTPMTFAKMLATVVLVALLSYAGRSVAQQPAPYRAVGFWPDISLSLGGGIGINGALDSNLHAALRLGALFAFQPWVINVGINGQLGALARRGVGGEVELNYLRGPFLQFGYDKVAGGDFMTRATIGFAVFGIQWQHRLAATKPDNALLFLLRLPFGIGWFFLNDQQRRRDEPPPPPPVVEYDG